MNTNMVIMDGHFLEKRVAGRLSTEVSFWNLRFSCALIC